MLREPHGQLARHRSNDVDPRQLCAFADDLHHHRMLRAVTVGERKTRVAHPAIFAGEMGVGVRDQISPRGQHQRVGRMLDRYGARPVFMTVAAMQVAFFALMPGLNDAHAHLIFYNLPMAEAATRAWMRNALSGSRASQALVA